MEGRHISLDESSSLSTLAGNPRFVKSPQVLSKKTEEFAEGNLRCVPLPTNPVLPRFPLTSLNQLKNVHKQLKLRANSSEGSSKGVGGKGARDGIQVPRSCGTGLSFREYIL